MRNRFCILALTVSFFCLIISACDGGKMIEKEAAFVKIEDVPSVSWENLSKKKIFFGHQSVGFNIIDGIKDLQEEHPGKIDLSIMETTDLGNADKGLLAHARVGRNKEPISKINAFESYMKQNKANELDMAFFKFCYVDVHSETDIHAVFKKYQDTMQVLEEAYPQTTFIHVTTPLRVVQSGIKAKIKKVIGKPLGGYADNIKRNNYNQLLRETYRENAPIFDLARIESTYPDGTRYYFKKNGKLYNALVPGYTEDGGHLNEIGRKMVAEQLLVYLASL